MNLAFDKNELAKISRKFEKLEKKEVQKITKKSLRKGMSLFRKKIIENAKLLDDPKTTNSIYKNVALRNKRRRDGNVTVMVGILGGARKDKNKGIGKGGDTYYWRFLEFGTSKMKARPFFRPAVEDTGVQNAVLHETQKQFMEEISKI